MVNGFHNRAGIQIKYMKARTYTILLFQTHSLLEDDQEADFIQHKHFHVKAFQELLFVSNQVTQYF